MTYCIYKLVNTVNSKVYIGFTSLSLNYRFLLHIKASRYSNPTKLYSAIRKHGEDAFSIELIERNDNLEYTLSVLEQKYIAEYNSINHGYNSRKGGGGIHLIGAKTKPVDVYDSEQTLLYTFPSMASAAQHLNVPACRISAGCRNAYEGKASQINGHWICYANEAPVYKTSNTSPGCKAARIKNTGMKRPEHAEYMRNYMRKQDRQTVFHFIHISGNEFIGSRMQLIEEYPEHTICNSMLGTMIRGVQKSHRDWSLLYPDKIPE